jgi:hypothetical protein
MTVKYTEQIKQQIQSSTEPMPWLHCLLIYNSQAGNAYAIFVWDSREIVEHGEFTAKNIIKTESAKDNGQDLTGKGNERFNAYFAWQRQHNKRSRSVNKEQGRIDWLKKNKKI